jgi:hypothetical protein
MVAARAFLLHCAEASGTIARQRGAARRGGKPIAGPEVPPSGWGTHSADSRGFSFSYSGRPVPAERRHPAATWVGSAASFHTPGSRRLGRGSRKGSARPTRLRFARRTCCSPSSTPSASTGRGIARSPRRSSAHVSPERGATSPRVGLMGQAGRTTSTRVGLTPGLTLQRRSERLPQGRRARGGTPTSEKYVTRRVPVPLLKAPVRPAAGAPVGEEPDIDIYQGAKDGHQEHRTKRRD